MQNYYFNTKSHFLGKILGRNLRYYFPILVLLAFPFINISKAEAETCTSSPCNTTFQVNVRETLAVQISTPGSWATGNVNEFLRNKVSVDVSTNNANGFTASMHSNSSTDLVNNDLSTATIPTLAGTSTRGSFPTNKWGYSLSAASLDGNTYGETDAGNNSSVYHPLTTSTSTPIKILEAGAGVTTGSQNIYFGAKADSTTPAGTYENTVVISVVTGTVDSNTNPITPSNPATPNSTTNTATYTAAPTGHATSGSTTYTYTRSSTSGGVTTNTTTTEISEGDNTSSYVGYTPPQGVTEHTEMNVSGNGSPLAATLATTASIAAASGLLFFIAAKRRKDDDDEEEEA